MAVEFGSTRPDITDTSGRQVDGQGRKAAIHLSRRHRHASRLRIDSPDLVDKGTHTAGKLKMEKSAIFLGVANVRNRFCGHASRNQTEERGGRLQPACRKNSDWTANGRIEIERGRQASSVAFTPGRVRTRSDSVTLHWSIDERRVKDRMADRQTRTHSDPLFHPASNGQINRLSHTGSKYQRGEIKKERKKWQ